MTHALSIRVVNTVVLMLAVVVMTFALVHLSPGDPALVIAGASGGITPQQLEQIREQYGLNQPLWTQMLVYAGQLLHGNLGHSYFFNEPVTTLILQRLGNSVLLAASAFVLSVGAGTLLGVLAARRPDGIFSNVLTVLALAGYSAPVFWLGIVLIIVFGVTVPVFPIGGMYSPIAQTGVAAVGDVAGHLVLPAIALGLAYLAQYSRVAKTSMTEVLESDFIRTARAKGVNEASVVFKHALRNAVMPVVSMAGVQAGRMVSGAILVETVFNWPGIGTLAVGSVQRRDTPVLLGIFLISSVMVIAVNFLTDVVYSMVDPRVRVGTAQA